MKQFGCAKNFSGQVGERVLKTIVKDHAQQTQRRVNSFASQCANREFEAFVYKYAYNNIGHHVNTPNNRLQHADTKSYECKGKFILHFSESDNQGRNGLCKLTWKDTTRNKCKVQIHDLVTHALRTYSCSVKWTKEFTVEGYTSGKIGLDGYAMPILFHANEFLFGKKRYDFCLVNFESEDNNGLRNNTCPAKILSFV